MKTTTTIHTAYRAEIRGIMTLREDRKVTCPNLRDYGFTRRAEFEAACHAWAVEQDRLYDVANRLSAAARDYL